MWNISKVRYRDKVGKFKHYINITQGLRLVYFTRARSFPRSFLRLYGSFVRESYWEISHKFSTSLVPSAWFCTMSSEHFCSRIVRWCLIAAKIDFTSSSRVTRADELTDRWQDPSIFFLVEYIHIYSSLNAWKVCEKPFEWTSRKAWRKRSYSIHSAFFMHLRGF